jgi:dUTP pyrophosphatase
MTLYIYASNADVKAMVAAQLAKHRPTDSGFDIPMRKNTIGDEDVQHTFKLGIHVAALDAAGHTRPSLLLPRSSIHKTPFRLCNSIGLIDQGYRGEVMAKTDILDICLDEDADEDAPLVTKANERLFQLVRNDFLPWTKVLLVNSLEELPASIDDRGAGGFGSTN